MFALHIGILAVVHITSVDVEEDTLNIELGQEAVLLLVKEIKGKHSYTSLQTITQ